MSVRRQTVHLAIKSVLQSTKVLPLYGMCRNRIAAFVKRRPHRSFRVTRQRDYARSLVLPGYWRFSADVWRVLWANRRLFVSLTAAYAVLTAVLVGIISETAYSELSGLVRLASSEGGSGDIGVIGQAGIVFLSTISGGVSPATDASRQVYAGLIGLLTWLTAVWLLRAILAGRKPKLRDGLYNAGSPILPTFLVSLVLVVQLLPLALVGIGYGAATASGLLAGGVGAMLFWLAAALLVVLSLYWATSTMLALVVVTLPGMYPMQALRTAGGMVAGRRVRILLRLAWLGAIVFVAWLMIMLPLIIVDSWLKTTFSTIAWLPVIPVALLILNSVTIVAVATYVYLLYRKVVEDDAVPAAN